MMKKILFLLLSLSVLLSCDKLSSPANGIYLNGERVSDLADGCAYGFGNYFGYLSDKDCIHFYVSARTAGSGRNIWDSKDLILYIRPYHSDVYPWEEVGQTLMINRSEYNEIDRKGIYALPSNEVLEELTLVRCPTGLLDVREKKGTTTGTAHIDISFVLSNGDEYQILYRGPVDTNHAELY